MGKAPLLTREQEVEVYQRIEQAEADMKRLVYGLGFTAKEHIALAEKLLSDPPTERFDHLVVDKQVGNRERHLRNLRPLIKHIQALDAQLDERTLPGKKSPPSALGKSSWPNSRPSLRNSRPLC